MSIRSRRGTLAPALSIALILSAAAVRASDVDQSASPPNGRALPHAARIGPIDGPDRTRPIALTGVLIRINGCEALDVYDGPEGPREILLRWTDPTSRIEWLQQRFDAFLSRWSDDDWQAWLDLGGGVQQSTSGMALHVYATGEHQACEHRELPIFQVSDIAPWDLDTSSPVAEAVAPRTDPFDPGHSAIARLYDGRNGRSGEMTVDIRGITDPSLGWPPWMVVGVGGSGVERGVDYGFLDLRYASDALEPDLGRELDAILAGHGVGNIDELSRSDRELVREEAQLRARRGPYRYTGFLTGEITRFRDTEALYLTPVFMVTGGGLQR